MSADEASSITQRISDLEIIVRGRPEWEVSGLSERVSRLDSRLTSLEQLRTDVVAIQADLERREKSRNRAMGWGVSLVIAIVGALTWPIVQALLGG